MVEDVDGEHDVEDVERADGHELRPQHEDEQAWRRLAGQRAQARSDRRERAAGVHVAGAGPDDRQDEQRGTCRDRGHQGEHGRRTAHGKEDAGGRRGREDADGFDPARDDVRGGELGWRAREPGDQRRLRWPRDGDGGGGERCEPVREQGRRAGAERGRSGGHGSCLRDVARGEDTRRARAVGEYRRERGEHRCGHELRQRDQTGRRRAALLVRVHEHRDPDAPLGGVEAGERELDAPEVGVTEDGARPAAPAETVAHRCRARRSRTACSIASPSSGAMKSRSLRFPSGNTSRRTGAVAVTDARRG